MLQIENLTVAYDQKEIVHGISLMVNQGETLALIGESGAGKTTLGLSLLRLAGNTTAGADCERPGHIQEPCRLGP